MATLMELRDEYDVFLRQEVSFERTELTDRVVLQRCRLTNDCFLCCFS
jgi:hypothetical protein